MMKIEHPQGGKLSPLGHSIRSALQNDSLPIIDILVRESIQNSLDAARNECDFVSVEYTTGSFECSTLNRELSEVEEALNKAYLGKENRFLAIRDLNTTGLTGKKSSEGFTVANEDNFYKLVYGINNEQTREDAGGAWGLGKTIYFRTGIGLVLYYSRIKDADGSFESRFAVSFFEDETKPDCFNKHPSGIAWWGEEVPGKETETQPITDTGYIKYILDIFGLKEYNGEETGTTIIIPYINEDVLLNSAKIATQEKKAFEISNDPYWSSNIEESIEIAIQRWYLPRLLNKKYLFGKYLRAQINGKKIELEPTFKIFQQLYNAASHNNNKREDEGEQTTVKSPIQVEDIVVMKICDDKKVGSLAYVKVSSAQLKMTAPDNKRDPFVYLGLSKEDPDSNAPIVCFTRKPGMIISYHTSGEWAKGIPNTTSNEFLFAIFVLNSDNHLKKELLSTKDELHLDQYVRKTEHADHFSWEDSFRPDILKKRIDVIDKIKKKVCSKLKDAYKENISETGDTDYSGIGRSLSKFFLPPIGFGTQPSVVPVSPRTGDKPTTKKAGSIFKIEPGSVRYLGQAIQLTISIQETFIKTGVEIQIDSAGGSIPIDAWESEMGMTSPFNLISAKILMHIDGQTDQTIDLNANKQSDTAGNINFMLEETEKSTLYGLSISAQVAVKAEFKVSICLSINSKNVQPTFKKWRG